MNTVNEYIEINNSRQNIMTMYTDEENPVLLIVHGGAGLPDRALVEKYNGSLAEYYTIVCWDQRGSGLSYFKGKVTADLLLSDLEALTLYLIKKYNQDKIYIAGHSWGSYLAVRFTHMHPEYIRYYIGTGQEVSVIEGEIDRYNFVLEEATKRNDRKVLEKLAYYGRPIEGNTYKKDSVKARNFVFMTVVRYAGYFSTKSDTTMIQYVVTYLKLYAKSYGLNLMWYVAGLVKSLTTLNVEMDSADRVSLITELSVPVLLISGEEDLICPVATAKRWFDKLSAPEKEFVIVENASHMVNFERPEVWNELVKNLLKAEN